MRIAPMKIRDFRTHTVDMSRQQLPVSVTFRNFHVMEGLNYHGLIRTEQTNKGTIRPEYFLDIEGLKKLAQAETNFNVFKEECVEFGKNGIWDSFYRLGLPKGLECNDVAQGIAGLLCPEARVEKYGDHKEQVLNAVGLLQKGRYGEYLAAKSALQQEGVEIDFTGAEFLKTRWGKFSDFSLHLLRSSARTMATPFIGTAGAGLIASAFFLNTNAKISDDAALVLTLVGGTLVLFSIETIRLIKSEYGRFKQYQYSTEYEFDPGTRLLRMGPEEEYGI